MKTIELGYNDATRAAMVDAARAFLSLADELNEKVSAYIDGSNDPAAEAAYYAVLEAEANFLRYNNAYYDEKRRPCLCYELAESVLPYEEGEELPEVFEAEEAGEAQREPAVFTISNYWHTRHFKIVDEFPADAVVWNIGRQNFPFPGFIPVAYLKNDSNTVDTDRLMAVRCRDELTADRILKAAGRKTIRKKAFEVFNALNA